MVWQPKFTISGIPQLIIQRGITENLEKGPDSIKTNNDYIYLLSIEFDPISYAYHSVQRAKI